MQQCTCSQKAKCASCVRSQVHPILSSRPTVNMGVFSPHPSIEKTANSSLGGIGILHLEKVTNTVFLSVTFLIFS